MSLIEEALRRAQDPLLPTASPPNSTRPSQPQVKQLPPQPSVQQSSLGTKALMATAASVFALTLVLIGGGAFWIGHAMTREHAAAVAPPPPPTPPQAPDPLTFSNHPEAVTASMASALVLPPLLKIRKPFKPTPELVLSGVLAGTGDAYAVINQKIVSRGEQINDLTLMEITESAVTLRDDEGNDTVLRVPR